MDNLEPRDLRHAVVLAVLVTAIAMFALLDPSCQRVHDAAPSGPSRSTSPE